LIKPLNAGYEQEARVLQWSLDSNSKNAVQMKVFADHEKFEKYLKDADLVITGEGKIDAQVKYGKTILGVAKLAKKYRIPVIALCGALTDEAYELHRYGISVLESIIPAPMNLDEAMKNAKKIPQEKRPES